MTPETKNAITELRTLASNAAKCLYRRIELAALVIGDLDWIAEFHQGSDFKACDSLTEQYFADIGQLIHVRTLVDIFKAFPDKTVWENNRFNLVIMKGLWEQKKAAVRQPSVQRSAARKTTAPSTSKEVDLVSTELVDIVVADDVVAYGSEVPGSASEQMTTQSRATRAEVDALQSLVNDQQELLERQAIVIEGLRSNLQVLQEENAKLRNDNRRLKNMLQPSLR